MKLTIARSAARDLEEIYDFIARDRPSAAERVLGRLVATFQRLAEGELQGLEIRFRTGSLARRWSVPPYRVYYRRSASQTTIVRVYHQARRSIEA